jgi:hypothetical protein
MPKPRIDASAELRDTLARTVCSFGTDPSEPCAAICVWCLENADTLIEVIQKYEEIHDQQQPNCVSRRAHRAHGR